MDKLISPEEVYQTFTAQVESLKKESAEAAANVVLLESNLQEARDKAKVLQGQYLESLSTFENVTTLIETSNKKWDGHISFLEDKYEKETQARFDTYEKDKEDFYIQGHKDASEEIKSSYKLTKKKSITKTKKKPLPVAKAIVIERARKKLNA